MSAHKQTEIDDCIPWPHYLRWAKEIKEFEVRNSDTIVAGPCKTGTNWMQEMVWLISSDFDYEGAKTELSLRFPMFEKCAILGEDAATGPNPLPEFMVDSIRYIGKQETPRFYKIHMPFFLLPEQIQNRTKKPKIIAMARNAKDKCISTYHFLKGVKPPNYTIDLETFCQNFIDSKGDSNISYWKFILSYWEQRHLDNVLFVKYEDMKANLTSVIRQVAAFLGKTITEEQIETLKNHLSFDQMKANQAVNFQPMFDRMSKFYNTKCNVDFMRSGNVGNYKQEMPENLIEKFDEWTKTSLEGTGLMF